MTDYRSSLVALMVGALREHDVTLIDEKDIAREIDEPGPTEISLYPGHEIDMPSDARSMLAPHARQSKGERKRNKRNRWR